MIMIMESDVAEIERLLLKAKLMGTPLRMRQEITSILSRIELAKSGYVPRATSFPLTK